MIKYVEVNGERFSVNMVTATIRDANGKIILKNKELKKTIINLVK